MNENIVRFKTRIFGGFDQRDVVNYLKLISAERNSLRGELMTLRKREQALSDELNRLCTLELSESVIDNAADILANLEAQHESIGIHIREIRERFEALKSED